MKAVRVRELLAYDPLELKDGLSGMINVLFEDGIVLELHVSEIVFNRYMWRILELYPELPIKSEHTVSRFYSNGLFSGKTVTKMFTSISQYLLYSRIRYSNSISNDMAKMWYRIYDVFEALYSELSYEIIDYIVSMDIEDLLDIQLDPELMGAINEVSEKRTDGAIREAYRVLDKVASKPEYDNNSVAIIYRAGTVNVNQMRQVLGPRGFVADINGHIFNYPIASSFTLGLKNLAEMAIESRTGAKAAYLATNEVAKPEYFGRLTQLAGMAMSGIDHGDCGTEEYEVFYIKPPDTGVKDGYRGDLPNMVGKRYLNEETGKLEVIKATDTHLNGKHVKLRSPLKCKHADKSKVCSTCFGDNAYNIPYGTNIGWFAFVSLTSVISQSVLSTKHLVTSAAVANIALREVDMKYFSTKDSSYRFNSSSFNRKDKVFMIITEEEAFGIKDIDVNSVKSIDPMRVTKIDNVQMRHVRDGEVIDLLTIPIRRDNRYGYFDNVFLGYIAKHGYSTDNTRGNIVIDMSKWSYLSPVIKLADMEFSFVGLEKDIRGLLKINTLKGGVSNISPSALLSKMYQMINTRLDINFALVEIIVSVFMVKDLKNNNYDLARGSSDPQLASMKKVVDHRSAGSSYGYDGFTGKTVSTVLFGSENRPNSPMDIYLTPSEVMADRSRHNKYGYLGVYDRKYINRHIDLT